MIPKKLKAGDHVRVIAPSHSFAPTFTKEKRKKAEERLGTLGLTISYGKYVDVLDDFKSASVEQRLEDLHDAFADPKVQAIIPARGGSSANQLLKHIDYDLIKKNPKIICGLSDITELASAIYTKTGLVTYYGPHYTALGTIRLIDYSIENINKTFFSDAPLELQPSRHFSNSEMDMELIVNDGFWTINEGNAEGKAIGGNFLTVTYLLGSEFIPDIEDTILFMEENKIIDFRGVQKELQSILNKPQGGNIKGLIFGRFQRETGMTRDLLTKMVKSKPELKDVPVIGNVDFGHTAPMLTFPIGGTVRMEAKTGDQVKIEIKEH